MGSGSTAVAAVRTGRHFLGYDTDPAYVDAARARVAAERAGGARPVSSGPADAAGTAGPTGLGGDKAVAVAAALLSTAGFAVDAAGRRKSGGVDVTLVATDARGRE